MDTKNFFSKIREIIREEIEYAIDKKLTQNKKTDKSTLEHGLSLYKESQLTKPKSNRDTKRTPYSRHRKHKLRKNKS